MKTINRSTAGFNKASAGISMQSWASLGLTVVKEGK